MQTSLIFPLIFVVLWSSAFATGSMVTDDATPFAALAFRFCLVTLGFLVVAAILREFSRFSRHALGHGMVTGVLFHGLYLGGCWYSFSVGIPAGVSALIVCIQPILTAIFAGFLLGEHISGKNWVGLALGFVGAILVLGVDFGSEYAVDGLIANVIALAAITTGTIWQKKYSSTQPLATNNAVQAASAAVFHAAVMWWFEEPSINFTLNFTLAMGWQIFAVSFGAFSVLMYLINKNSASQTSALFFLVPPVAALMGFMLLDERLTTIDMFGFAVASFGVYLATRKSSKLAG
ncbi:MAG: DMT family transporter [Gammaproteobacteria bacterium]|nr:DMT family transporter [Gammaproteobacteria bacterium]